ncbi:unnamed protein product [Cyclocybe aegerita]|uniref:F-box domain-containing protein n=1 Tax=Cyclocybe aegerita TaxID=1973307 RepID=A0A8S0XSL0_CYCAE|nr:unnamed protein product [Cyclocybe aegerita]
MSDSEMQDARSDSDGEEWENAVGTRFNGKQSGLVDFPMEMLPAMLDNEPPDAIAMESARALKEEPERMVPELEKKLEDVAARLEDLKRMQVELMEDAEVQRTMLQGCCRVLAPIRRVPLDILCEIARHLLPSVPSAKITEAPLSLSHVSSAWRMAVLSSAELWSKLNVYIPSATHLPRSAEGIRKWFERARGRPLDLSLHLHFPMGRPRGRRLLNFLLAMSDITPRFRRFSLSVPEFADFLPHLVEIPWTFPQLESLSISSTTGQFYNEDYLDIVVPPVLMFNSATNLRTLEVSKVFATIPGSHLIMPWARLTSVELTEGLPLLEWIRVMVLCEQMTSGDFLVRDSEEDDLDIAKSQPKYTHPNVETLKVTILYTHPLIVELLSLFNLPRLHSLTVAHEEAIEDYPDGPPNLFPEFSNLQYLSLSDCIPTANLIAILRETTNLHTFEFNSSSSFAYPDPLYCAMSLRASPAILSKLAVFKLLLPDCWDPEYDLTLLISMVESRYLAVPSGLSPLQELSLSYPFPQLTQALAPFGGAGLNISYLHDY